MEPESFLVDDPRAEYTRRLNSRRATVAKYGLLDSRIAYTRLGLFFLALLIAAASMFGGLFSSVWLVPPVALFACIAVAHERVLRSKEHAANAVTFYEKGLARVEDRWAGMGLWKEALADDSHPYAVDLDLFGSGSLFELVCTARTRSGQLTLAEWFLAAANRDEILARQAAVEELRMRLDLREWLATADRSNATSAGSQSLSQWGADPAVFPGRWPRFIAVLLSGLLLVAATAGAYSESDAGSIALGVGLVAASSLGLIYRSRVQAVVEPAAAARGELVLLANLLPSNRAGEPYLA